MRIYNIYLPHYRYELILYLGTRYPEDMAKFRRFKINRLKAIYYSLRNREQKNDHMFIKKEIRQKGL